MRDFVPLSLEQCGTITLLQQGTCSICALSNTVATSLMGLLNIWNRPSVPKSLNFWCGFTINTNQPRGQWLLCGTVQASRSPWQSPPRCPSPQPFPHQFCCPVAQYYLIHCNFPVVFKNFSKILHYHASSQSEINATYSMPFTLHFQQP